MKNWNKYQNLGAGRLLENNRPSSTTERTENPPKTEENDVTPEDILLEEEIVIIDDTVENEENQEEEGNEMKKQLIEKAELFETLEEFVTEYPSVPALYAAIEELCRTICIEDAGIQNADVVNNLRAIGISQMDALKIQQGFIQSTVEATEKVLKGLSAFWRSTMAQAEAQNQADESTSSQEQEKQENQQAPEDEPEDELPEEETPSWIDELLAEEYDPDAVVVVNEKGEDNKTEEREEDEEGGDDSSRKHTIDYDQFRRIVAGDLSVVLRSSWSELRDLLDDSIFEFVDKTFSCTEREWNHKPAKDRVNNETIKYYAKYLLENFYKVDSPIDGEDPVDFECIICETQDKLPHIFQQICEKNPKFSFGDAMLFLEEYVVYGFDPCFDAKELKHIYERIRGRQRHESRQGQTGSDDSTAVYDAWKQANGSGESSGEETGERTDNNKPSKGEGPQYDKPEKKNGLLVGLVVATIVILVVGAITIPRLFRAFMAEDEEWGIEAPVGQPAIQGENESPAAEEAEAEAEAVERSATASSGLDIVSSSEGATEESTDASTSTSASVEQKDKPEKGVVVNAAPCEDGSAFDLPANQFGAFAKVDEGYYTCITKVTPDQAQLMLNEMNKNKETSHSLRYIVMPESGLILVQNISINDVEAIMSGENDGYVAHFNENEFVQDKITEEDSYYTVCKRISIAEVKELIDNSSPTTDEVVVYKGTGVMITNDYMASNYVINRAALVNIYHVMKEIGATEVSSLFHFEKSEVEQGNVSPGNA